VLELAWSLDMIESTALGTRLTSVGESYFDNAISDCRTLAPDAYAQSTQSPTIEELDYATSFGGTVTSLTATIVGSPVTLTSGANTVDTGATTGTFTVDLNLGTGGTAVAGTATLTGDPVTLVSGETTLTVTAAGTVVITVALADTTSSIDDATVGTGWDLTTLATTLGMSRWMLSTILWLILSVIACGGVYAVTHRGQQVGGAASGKIVMPLFVVMLLIGTLLGMIKPIVMAYMSIGAGAFIGYILFFKNSADIGRTTMFFGFMWLITIILGGFMAGYSSIASTELTADITDTDTTITVSSTTGFPEPGTIVIGNERITYSSIASDTTFGGSAVRPLLRGTGDTDAVAHSSGEGVRTVEVALINSSIDYNISVFSDSSGLLTFIQIPIAVFDFIKTLAATPWGFLGVDGGAFITVIWGICFIGFIISIFIAIIGGRSIG